MAKCHPHDRDAPTGAPLYTGTIGAGQQFEGQAATGQDPYADDYFFYRYDVRGSVTNIVDGEGAVVKSYDYDEFGVTTSTGDAFFNEVTFTGSVADASGLLYMNARYYNPATARFLSQDTYTGSASDPWTQHLYAYCNNNPVNMVDPTGHAPVGPMRKNMVCINDGGMDIAVFDEIKKEQKYISNQNHESIASLPFGPYGNISQNGCGSIAIFNAMIAAGKDPGSFEEFNAKLNIYNVSTLLRLTGTSNPFLGVTYCVIGSHLLGGILGMNPLAMDAILQDEFGPSNVDRNVLSSQTDYDAIVVLYLWSKPSENTITLGGHYVAAIKTGDYYYVYNTGDKYNKTGLNKEALRSYFEKEGWAILSWGINFAE